MRADTDSSTEEKLKALAAGRARIAVFYEPGTGWCVTDDIDKLKPSMGPDAPEYRVIAYRDWTRPTLAEAIEMLECVRRVPGRGAEGAPAPRGPRAAKAAGGQERSPGEGNPLGTPEECAAAAGLVTPELLAQVEEVRLQRMDFHPEASLPKEYMLAAFSDGVWIVDGNECNLLRTTRYFRVGDSWE